jgi:hypothetical protein
MTNSDRELRDLAPDLSVARLAEVLVWPLARASESGEGLR